MFGMFNSHRFINTVSKIKVKRSVMNKHYIVLKGGGYTGLRMRTWITADNTDT